MGWQPTAEVEGDVVFFQAGGMVVALWGRDKLAEDSAVQDNGGWGGVTLAYNVGSAEEVDAVIGEARAAGAVIGRLSPPRRSGAGTRRCSPTRTGTRGRSRTTPAGP